jgi:DNA-binding winged helix-turn-helix (wHTH) protein
MLPPPITSRLIRFGTFAVDPKSRELFKQGMQIILQAQPFQVLSLLLEHRGDIVTREELRKALWPRETFVDFDQGLNKAINKLRKALGDSAESPRYIETLNRCGYRLIDPLNRTNPDAPSSTRSGEALHPTAALDKAGGAIRDARPWRTAIGRTATAAFRSVLGAFGLGKQFSGETPD